MKSEGGDTLPPLFRIDSPVGTAMSVTVPVLTGVDGLSVSYGGGFFIVLID